MLKSLNATLDGLVERTAEDRDRTVDFLRAGSITVVILWHWSLSIIHRDADDVISMPNPIAEVPLAWLGTWVLQVMPIFFFIGGFANLLAWQSDQDRQGWRSFYRRRARRLLIPVAVFIAVWVVVDTVLAVGFGARSVVEYGDSVFMPLWFIGTYLWVIALVPLTAVAHQRWGVGALVALAAVVALLDVGRFAAGIEALGWANTALIWVLIHQLGYFYGSDQLRRWTTTRRALLTAAAFVGLAAVTTVGPYQRSMVAHTGSEISPMFPTTAVIALLALAQFSLVLTLRPWLSQWLATRSVWKVVIAMNLVIMTLFLWHKTALLVVIVTYEALGFELWAEPAVEWWIQRPLWIVAPAAVLAVLVAVFSTFEVPGRDD